ncbi:hypothetical protein EW146_g8197 [Bondarzewia mesenterica]|uniref:Arrestin-like N-terminal domain-containing protein n=1 Tax=Bondarzewia mesenterica TaxID=1095465 RepID=A0A4S4LI56_9AGAM|nr:hypothetical protein EW146_g8197 [Bondarzewia mesenterica]
MSHQPLRFEPDDLATDELEFVSSPPYSSSASESERVIQATPIASTSARTLTDDPQPSSCTHFFYKFNVLEINLGRKLWGLSMSAYGFNDIVNGTVQLLRECTHVVQLTATLQGKVNVTSVTRGMVEEVTSVVVVSDKVDIPGPRTPVGAYYLTDHLYTFSIPFPSYVKGGMSPLPPSYAVWTPGVSCDVSYVLKIDVFRKGMRRHEEKSIPLLYLPKSWPPRLPFPEGGLDSGTFDGGMITTIPLSPKFRGNTVRNNAVESPSFELSLPANAFVSSGFHLPLKLVINCPEAPALSRLLCQHIEVKLVKQTRLWVKNNRLTGGRETVLSSAVAVTSDASREGQVSCQYLLKAGESGKEQTWRVDGAIEISYIVRVSICPPCSSTGFLPSYSHNEVINIATEPWGGREREVRQVSASYPALGLSNSGGVSRLSQSIER